VKVPAPAGIYTSTLPTGSAFASTRTPTAATAHDALKTFVVLFIFVILATIAAGQSQAWAKTIEVIMFGFLVMQGLTHGAAFAGFAEKFDLAPPPN